MRYRKSLALALGLSVALPIAGWGPPVHAAAPDYLQQTIVRGAAIHGSNGLAVDHAGRLLVASVWGQQLVAVDRSTGKVLQRYGPMVGDQQLGTPDDVAIAPDGSIYYTDILGGMVGRISTDGHLTKQAVAPFANPIAFDAQGRLFVGQALQGDCLYEVDPALVAAPTKILCGSGAPGYPDQLNGFDFGPDGKLYAPQPALARIVRIDVATKTMTVVADDLGGNPTSVEFNAKGQLFADLGQGPIVRVDTTTGAVTKITTLPPELDNMAFDASGRLYVSSSNTGRVDRVNTKTGSHRQLVKGGLIIPGGVAVMPQPSGGDHVVMADLWRLATYNGLTGRRVALDTSFGAFGIIPGTFTVAVDGPNLILTCWTGQLVTVWDPVARAPIAVYEGFGAPLNAIPFGDDLVVAALGPAPVTIQAPGGARTPLGAGSIFVPTGLAATNDDLWVADWATGMVWQLVKDGVTLAAPAVVTTGLVRPEGLAVDVDGSLLVVETPVPTDAAPAAGRLTRIDPATGTRTTIASGLGLGTPGPSSAPPTWIFNGVAVGPSGDIYVTGDTAAVLYRFSPVP
jgi:sugar lactone lactonase YvrE